jgi:hypothetical protein
MRPALDAARNLLRVTLELQDSVAADRYDEAAALLSRRSAILDELVGQQGCEAVEALLGQVSELEARLLGSWTARLRGAPGGHEALKAYGPPTAPGGLDEPS